jgi:hypothetical protein
MNNKPIVICSVCFDYEDKTIPKWYTPTPEERRRDYLSDKKLSHTFCPTCYVMHMKKDGFSDNEIESILEKIIHEK